ncbi:MAG: bifunctional precorrin-2 dehydrogenase/sirohydrochlorin ferrochelatase [Oscillospiraceae bacterium]|nr:bifunctional precorrin-2 dehydrogenase/sirohydrochlorin ferrochelatase [Oscillospiraceae bacterium]
MSYYPILIDWQGVPCLIAGGGAVALHKAEVLCAKGADVTVVAPKACPQLSALPVTVHLRAVTAEDVTGKRLVIDATGDDEAQRMLLDVCRVQGIPFNSACRVGEGTAIFPAVRQKGRTTVAVSTMGASPAACALLRDELAARIPETMDAILDNMAALRPLSREWFDDQLTRKRFLHRCLDEMLKRGRPLDPEETEALRREITDKKTEENEP